jgi:hypothetical protein
MFPMLFSLMVWSLLRWHDNHCSWCVVVSLNVIVTFTNLYERIVHFGIAHGDNRVRISRDNGIIMFARDELRVSHQGKGQQVQEASHPLTTKGSTA